MQKNKIKVFNSPKAFVESVTVYTFGMIINLSRGLFKMHSEILENKWKKYSGIELKNKKLGIIGFGNIGQNIAKIGKSFGMKILINDIDKRKIYKSRKKGYKSCSKKVILNNSDFLVLATDLNPKSFHLIDNKDFKEMKKNIIIVNISRGPVMSDKALLNNLNKNIGGLGLDVFENEPLSRNHKIKKFHNVVLSSHNAFNTKEAVERTNKECIYNLIKGLKHAK